jgi:aspartate carbamoyltransferase catalytic subunit
MTQPRKHLLGLEGMNAREIYEILDLASGFHEILERPVKKVPTLRGRSMINAFFEPSTRTRVSFELAQKRLSADTINISTSGSSLSKARRCATRSRISSVRVDMIIIRHSVAGVPQMRPNARRPRS